MKNLHKLGLAATSLILGASFVHPFGPAKRMRSDLPLFMEAAATPEIEDLVERACQNCHSERTEWPWYSYVAPMSWMIEKDVSSARAHLNLSHWKDYAPDQQADLLARIGVEVRNDQMPLPKYLQLHPEARLSSADVQQIYTWAHRERKRLSETAAKEKAPTD